MESSLQPVAKRELFPYLSGRDLLNLCQTNTTFAKLCQDQAIWESKVRQELAFFYHDKPNDLSWRQYYLDLAFSPKIKVYLHNEILDLPRLLLTQEYLFDLMKNGSYLAFVMTDRNVIIDLVDPEDPVLVYQGLDANLNKSTLIIILSKDDPTSIVTPDGNKKCIRTIKEYLKILDTEYKVEISNDLSELKQLTIESLTRDDYCRLINALRGLTQKTRNP